MKTNPFIPVIGWLATLIFFPYNSYAKNIRFEDYVYEPTIQSVQMYVKTGKFDEQTNFPVVSLFQTDKIYLEFDDLKDYTEGYYFKIIHCNADWTPSVLFENEYLNEFINDYLITDYQLSFNTMVKYVHYRFKTPKLRLSGNYILAVMRGSETNDYIITRRFMVFDTKVTIKPDFKVSIGVEERFTHQQLDFNISYKNYPMIFVPQEEVKVVLRQNGRWDNAIYDLKPLYIRDNERLLDYHFFNLENNFPGGNEFRQFDCRRIRTQGINIGRIEETRPVNTVYLMQEQSRNGKPYLFYFDINGRFIIGNNEIGGNLTDPDYVNVVFDLKSELLPGQVFVLGDFNYYQYDPKYQMQYNADSKSYQCTVLMKQGYYNYIYSLKNRLQKKGDETFLEGSFFQTENFYDIIVYHRRIGERHDEIVGYYSAKVNTWGRN